MMARSGSQLLSVVLLALLAICAWGACIHLQQDRSLLLWLQLPQLLLYHCQPWPASLQALASIGTGTWGVGTLHGETASVVMMVVFVTVIFALLGAGGSTRKA